MGRCRNRLYSVGEWPAEHWRRLIDDSWKPVDTLQKLTVQSLTIARCDGSHEPRMRRNDSDEDQTNQVGRLSGDTHVGGGCLRR